MPRVHRELPFLLAFAFVTRHAAAQSDAAADALFQAGRDLAAAGDYAKACEKFEASQQLDPALGTLLNIGECNEKQQKLASAWAAFNQAHTLAVRQNDTPRITLSAQLRDAVGARMSKITIQVPPESRLPGLTVELSGRDERVLIPEGSFGVPLPRDGGSYTVVVKAPGHSPITATIQLSMERDAKSYLVPTLPKEAQPAIQCPPGTVYAEANQQCVASPPECESGYELVDGKGCERVRRCEPGFEFVENRGCVSSTRRCEAGFDYVEGRGCVANEAPSPPSAENASGTSSGGGTGRIIVGYSLAGTGYVGPILTAAVFCEVVIEQGCSRNQLALSFIPLVGPLAMWSANPRYPEGNPGEAWDAPNGLPDEVPLVGVLLATALQVTGVTLAVWGHVASARGQSSQGVTIVPYSVATQRSFAAGVRGRF